MSVALLIPAAGSGERLGRALPKALVEIGGRPLVRWTLEALAQGGPFVETVVLAPAASAPAIQAAVAGAPGALGAVRVVAGGSTRQASVRAGLDALQGSADVVCVHDAARPLVDAATVRAVLEAAARGRAATAASRPVDTVRMEIDGRRATTQTLERARLWLVETPQAFERALLLRAHERAAADAVQATDDASLVEALGVEIQMVESKSRNLKITTELDLVTAREVLRRR